MENEIYGMSDSEVYKILRQRVLDRVPFSFSVPYEKNWLEQTEVRTFINNAADQLSVQLNTAIPGVSKKTYFYVPSSTWQMFKMEYFPQWLINRFPVMYDPIPAAVVNYLFPYNRFGDRVQL